MKSKIITVIACQALFIPALYAQTANGSAGITQATTQVAGYFDVGCNLMYAIGAVVGLIGAVKV